ncbi:MULTISPECIES: hypothetical protein [Rhodonellum]|nr:MULTISPECIES: hypothetical protein [Rhodonellum]SDZ46977.1 hypothetical protein SAMN05444412_1166 [Rhodonellum ikkaensis]
MKYYLIKVIFVLATVPYLVSEKIPQSKNLPIIPHYQDEVFSGPKAIGQLANKKINEASGLAFSRSHKGIVYTHNDSGHEPYVYLTDTLGKDRGIIKLKGVKNRDWEDIAVGPGPDKKLSYVYVGEIGDNNGVHKNIKIFRFPEPKNVQLRMEIKPETLTLTYPDGPKDAETLMVDPRSGDFFIVSKRDSTNTLYRAPKKAFEKEQYVLEKVMELPFTMAVAGDISADGSQILIKNYFTVFYWERKNGESIPEALGRKPLILPYKTEPQGEAIGFHPSGNSYFTLSEKSFGIAPVLYRYDKK